MHVASGAIWQYRKCRTGSVLSKNVGGFKTNACVKARNMNSVMLEITLRFNRNVVKLQTIS